MSGIHQGHEQSSEALSAYLDGALDSAERDAVELRLATCDACRAELADLRRVRALLRALTEVTPPRSFTLPATTTPPRRADAPRPGQGWARAAQWMGGLAAVIGVGLMLAGGLMHPSYSANFSAAAPDHSVSSQGGASSAPAPTTDHHTPVNQGSTSTAGAATAPPSPTTATTYGPLQTGTPTARPEQSAASPAIPLGPAGVTLLVGGGAALAAGTAARRRKSRPDTIR